MRLSGERESMPDQAFWSDLESLHDWKKRNLPLLMMPQGEEVLTWLMRVSERPRPLKELYANSRFSEPTVRVVVQSLVDRKLVVFQYDDRDQRARFVRPTEKLVELLDEYVRRIQNCSI